jgi:hypothetical protein
MARTTILNVTSDLGNGFDRVRVDVGQTGFFEGREFRSYHEFASENSNAIAVDGSLSFKFVCPVDFILQSQSLIVDKGGIRLQAFSGGVDGGGWSSISVVGKNRSASRRKYGGGFYEGQGTMFFGGSFTEGTQVDVIRCRVASQSVTSSNVGANQDDERYLPSGTYFIRLEPLDGVNDASEGVYSIAWEER